MKNYLDYNENKNEYYTNRKYFEVSSMPTNLVKSYSKPISQGLNIFTNVDDKYFDMDLPISQFLQIFKDEFIKVSQKIEQQKILPKLSIQFEDDNSKVIYWSTKLFRIYFSFEEKEDENNYGIVENNQEEGIFSTRNGWLKKEEYKSIVDNFIQYVIKNT